MTQRAEQIKVANDLQKILGNKYKVRYDDCESCLTRVLYTAKNGETLLVKEVPNTEMKSGLSVTDFELSRDQRMYLLATNNL